MRTIDFTGIIIIIIKIISSRRSSGVLVVVDLDCRGEEVVDVGENEFMDKW